MINSTPTVSFDYERALSMAETSVVRLFNRNGNDYERFDVDEVVSATMLKVMTYSSNFDPEKGSLRSWVSKIAHNCWVDYEKQRSKSQSQHISLDSISRDFPQEEDDFSIDINDVKSARMEEIEAALSTLSEQDSEIIDSVIYGLDYAAIAEEQNMTVDAVRTRVCRIRKHLKKILF